MLNVKIEREWLCLTLCTQVWTPAVASRGKQRLRMRTDDTSHDKPLLRMASYDFTCEPERIMTTVAKTMKNGGASL